MASEDKQKGAHEPAKTPAGWQKTSKETKEVTAGVVICMSTVGGGCSSMCYGRSCAYCVQAGMSELVVAE